TDIVIKTKPTNTTDKQTAVKDDKKQADIYPKPAITVKRVIDKRVAPVEVDAKKNNPANTTTPQTAATDIPAGAHWAVVALVCQTRTKADAVVSQYKQNGLNAFILSVRGSVIKVAAGGYATNDEADSARAQLVESKKIPKDAYLQEIKLNK
ncbi:MAG TPA: SPOR domain-containing protein, partial [Mucilaginibacter sp.]